MASSQSFIHKPEAPVAPFDLGILSKVLLYKQSKFDQGADLIQAKISQLENQQVLGESQKKYLSEKVNGMIEGVNGMGGLDFSDRNILNQTGSYVDSITKDPIISSAISNTRNIQKGVAYFDKIKQDAASGKKGVYYNPANEYDYMENVNDYLRKSKTDVNAAYSDRPITPPVDVNRLLMEEAKNVVASKYTERDGTNRYILKTGEIVTPERLYSSVLSRMQTDPNLANQIRINAKYNYLQKDQNGNLNPNQLQSLKQAYLQSNEGRISSLQEELVRLASDKASTSDNDKQIGIQSQIDNTAKELQRYVSSQNQREEEINSLILSNPEAAASNVYSNKLLEGIVAARAFREEKVQFDQSAMFIDKMNLQKDAQLFDQQMEEKKLALETTKVAIAAQEAADKAGKKLGEEGLLISEAVSLPTNLRKSSQDAQINEIRAIDMQKANVQQDYYHYLYQFKNDSGLVTKNGNVYQPTDKAKGLWEDNMKKLKDHRDGKTLPIPLDPEFIKLAIKYQELDLVKKQNEDEMVSVNREAINLKRKELGLSDKDYELFLRGKALNDQLPDRDIKTLQQDQTFAAPTFGNKKDYRGFQETPENLKAISMYRKYNKDLIADEAIIEKLYQAKSSQIIPRVVVPVGLKDSDLEARASLLKGQIADRGYFSLNGSQKPEQTVGKDVMQADIKYIGDAYMDLGNGVRPYVKAEISNGLKGDKEVSQTVYVDVDSAYISNFKNFAQNVNEAARQQVLRNDKVSFDSASSDGKNVIKTEVIKNSRGLDSETASIKVYVTHDATGKPITPEGLVINGTPFKNMNISQSVTFAKDFAEKYSTWYKEGIKAGIPKNKLRVKDLVNKLNEQ